YGFRCCHLKNIWTAPLPPETELSRQMTTSTTSIDIMGLQAAYANLHTDQERDYFMQRYHDVISSFGGKTSYDADNRPLLVKYSGLKSPTECQQSLFESHFASRQSLSDCPVAFWKALFDSQFRRQPYQQRKHQHQHAPKHKAQEMQQQDNHEYPFLYQRQTCHQVQPNQATYQKRQKCQPATYLQEVLYQL